MFGHATYLIFELGWAAPVLIGHWLVGRQVLLPRLGLIAVAASLPTVYLSCADGVAIHSGIWVLHADHIVGFAVADVPIEETVFFLLTDLMVVQTVLLLRHYVLKRQHAGNDDPG